MTVAYDNEQAAFGRQVQWLVEITLDRCDNTYTQSPCAAVDQGDGARCHYSYPTCQDVTNFVRGTRVLYFVLNEVPWDDPTVQTYPYLKKHFPIPQVIKPQKLEVYPAKITARFSYDWEPGPMDHDKGAGFYNTARTGEFWRNLIARNRNYPGRPMRVLRGFKTDSFTLADFAQIGPVYYLTQIKRDRDYVEIVAESKLAQLKDRTLPFEVGEDNTIQDSGGLDGTATTFTVLDGGRYPNPADYIRNRVYVQVDSEKMEVTDITGNVLTVVRQSLNTVGTTHQQFTKVSHILFIGSDQFPDPPVGITPMAALQNLLEWIDVPVADVDTAAFDDIEESLWQNPDVLRIITKPKKVAKLFYSLRLPRLIVMFINDDNKWSVAVVGPGVSQGTLTNDNFVLESTGVEENDEERATRAALFYDPVEQNDDENPEDMAKAMVYIDAELENDNFFGEVKELNFVDPWIWADIRTGLVTNAAARLLTRHRYGDREWSFMLEIVDGDYSVGDQITIISDLVTDAYGNSEGRPCMISSKKEIRRNTNEYKAIDTGFSGLYFRIGDDSRAENYNNSVVGEKDSYWSKNTERLGDVNDPAAVFF